MKIRRLERADYRFVEQAFEWDLQAPPWYRSVDQVYGPQSPEEFVGLLENERTALIGVFDPHLVAIIAITMSGTRGTYEASLWAKRGISMETLRHAGIQVRDQIPNLRYLTVWVAHFNRPVRKLCASWGFVDSGKRIFKGHYKKRVLIWQEFVYSACQLDAEAVKAA